MRDHGSVFRVQYVFIQDLVSLPWRFPTRQAAVPKPNQGPLFFPPSPLPSGSDLRPSMANKACLMCCLAAARRPWQAGDKWACVNDT